MARNPRSSTLARELLASTGARKTLARETVLSILLDTTRALTHQEIVDMARKKKLSADRVTIYRVLNWLVGQHLAHKITLTEGIARYNAIQNEAQSHAHFHCTRCGRIICLEELNIGFISALPQGFQFGNAEITIEGRCPHCSRR